MNRYTFARHLVALITVGLVVAACQPASTPSASGSPGQIGGTVSVLATWGGSEQDSFLAMVKPFEDQTGVKVQYEGTRDNAVLTTRIQGGNPPDLAGLPGPGLMAQLAKAGKLIDLGNVLDMNAMKSQYSDSFIKLAQVDGKQVGIFIKAALKGPIWYNPKAFSAKGYTVPKTWDDLTSLSKKIADSGTTPWCIGLESGAASGWPGTDWLEDIVIRQSGPDVYDSWWQGKTKWSSPEIKKAFQTWGTIIADPKMVLGGKSAMVATAFGDSGNPMFTNPPKCYMHHQASFITDFFTKANPALKPGDDFNFFMTPDIDSKYAGAVTGAGDLFGMFKDTPQARALIKYLTTPQAQAIWVKRGGALSANKQVTDYPDKISADSAKALTSAGVFRFDASDLMPEAMNQAFWKAVLDYVNDPSKLDSILTSLDKVQADSYK
ncbi:MAG: carbohydrate ABC transporter substrate-binding protein [Chloroflexi bacterium]|nr:MAG: carbohydrate ABC transporter substrate-binding protein [Chloroflexota bacterium]TMC35753.1 MAG: carbohydrate ABC transporter substrate-binding protein [Chloroflexota bacterium]